MKLARAVLLSLRLFQCGNSSSYGRNLLATETQREVQMRGFSILSIPAFAEQVDGLSHTDTDRLMLTYSYHSGLAELRNLLAVTLPCNQLHFSFCATAAAFCGNARLGV